MEWIIRFGADKRKAKIIEEQLKEIASLREEVRGLKIDNGVLVIKNDRLNKSLNYYKKKVGNKNEISTKPRVQTNHKVRSGNIKQSKKEM